MTTTPYRLLPVVSVFAAAPALACGGPDISTPQMAVLTLSLFTAPFLAALIVDRGAFALAAQLRGHQRRHRPTAVGPVVATAALLLTFAGVSLGHVNLAITGFALVPVAAAVCALSFLRSVIIEQRGHASAQALRIVGVVGFSLLALAPFLH